MAQATLSCCFAAIHLALSLLKITLSQRHLRRGLRPGPGHPLLAFGQFTLPRQRAYPPLVQPIGHWRTMNSSVIRWHLLTGLFVPPFVGRQAKLDEMHPAPYRSCRRAVCSSAEQTSQRPKTSGVFGGVPRTLFATFGGKSGPAELNRFGSDRGDLCRRGRRSPVPESGTTPNSCRRQNRFAPNRGTHKTPHKKSTPPAFAEGVNSYLSVLVGGTSAGRSSIISMVTSRYSPSRQRRTGT